MKNLIKLEELAIFAMSACIIYSMDLKLDWWLYPLLFFAPDIGMLGYLVNTKVGAVTYNFLHHQGVAALVILLGVILLNEYWILVGLLLFAHSSFDRVLGYGLKYPDSFKHTNIGYM